MGGCQPEGKLTWNPALQHCHLLATVHTPGSNLHNCLCKLRQLLLSYRGRITSEQMEQCAVGFNPLMMFSLICFLKRTLMVILLEDAEMIQA